MLIAGILTALIIAVVVFRSVSTTLAHPSEDRTVVAKTGESGNASATSPHPYLEPDTEVLIYVGEGADWQPTPFGAVPRGVEFLFNGHLYHIDQDGGVWLNPDVKADAAKLADTDRAFEPYNWRWPEREDVVRFIGHDNHHLRHDRMGTCRPGDRFWFQGVLYEGFAEPDSPSGFAYRPTMLVLNSDGYVLPVEEFAAARGDNPGEVYGSHVSSSVADGPTGTFPDPGHSLASANPVANTSGSVYSGRGSSSGSVLPVHNAAGLDSTGGSPANLGFSEQHDSLQSSVEANSDWGLPTDFGFTGQRWDQSIGLYDYRSRFYDPKLGRFISPDPIVPNPGNPQDLNRYAYCRNNPLRYTDPDGHTVRSALDLIHEYRSDINSLAAQYNLDPVLLAGVVFAENRNDYNWIRGQDWSSAFTLRLFGGPEIKNIVSPLVKDNPSIGITEVSVAVAAMMDNSGLVPDNYVDLSWEERSELHTQIAANLSEDERQGILDNLADPQMSLEYTAKYLNFLAGYRDYGDDHALLMSDYNRGLSDWDTTTEYGRRIDVYRENIEHALNWEPTEWICVGGYGCGVAYDRQIYGELP